MKKTVLIMLALCLLSPAWGQRKKCGVETRALMAEQVAAGATQLRFLAQLSPGYDRQTLRAAGITVSSQAGDVAVLNVPVGSLSQLDANPYIQRYSISHTVGGPMMDNTRSDTRTDQVEAGIGLPVDHGYDGSGVYVGITDWGFDYTHPNLNAGNRNNWRIDHAWDHFRHSQPTPAYEGLGYGTLISGHSDLIKAKGDTSNLYGYGTHGTHVAGIAAGSGTSDGHFRGQAPGAHMLLCSFGLGEAEWIDAACWMRNVAADSNRRLVVNSSWGMYSFSNLDGTSLLSRAIDNMSDEGVVFVTSGGNNGDANFHISRNFDLASDTLRTVASWYTLASDAIGQCLILWGEAGKDFTTRFRLQTADAVYEGPLVNTADEDQIIYDTLQCGEHRVPFRIIAEHANPNDGRPHVQMDVNRAPNVQLQLFVVAESGTVHAWNVANKTNHAGNEGARFHNANRSGFSNGDNLYGIGEPACANSCISVAAHHADTWTADSSQYIAGDIAYFSSYGPRLDGQQKPDLSAPGYQVVSSISIWTDGDYDAVATQNVGMKRYIWSPLSGTSMSSPAVTGIVALLLQANPDLTPQEIRNILITTTRNDEMTGALHDSDSASISWGWGKIDAQAAIVEALKDVSVQQVEESQSPLMLFPNPATHSVTVGTGCGEPIEVHLLSVDGRKLMTQTATAQCHFDLSSLPAGVYIVQAGSRVSKLVVQ